MSFPPDRPSTWFVTGTSRGLGLYCTGKFALEGLSEALAAEVADFGVTVTIVEPGYFRTEFLTRDSLALPAAVSDAYPGIREMTENHLNLQGSQLGDPVEGAAAIIDRVVTGEGPLRLLLGSDAHAYATAKVDVLRANLDATAQTAPGTDHATVCPSPRSRREGDTAWPILGGRG